MKLKEEYPHIAVGQLCGLFGKTRHAYYDHKWRTADIALQDEIILQLVVEIRLLLPGIGTRKLHYLMAPKLKNHAFSIGRDQLFALLDEHKLLIRKRKRKAVTTDSRHRMRKYPNLIAELEVQEPEMVWVSDITYVWLVNEFAYLSRTY
jgi:putative transposase